MTDYLDERDLAIIDGLCAKASDGPWCVISCDDMGAMAVGVEWTAGMSSLLGWAKPSHIGGIEGNSWYPYRAANFAFAAAAREYLPAAVSMIRAMQDTLKELQDTVQADRVLIGELRNALNSISEIRVGHSWGSPADLLEYAKQIANGALQ